MIIQNSADIKTELFYDENGDIAPVDVRYERHTINPNGLVQLRNIPSVHTVFNIKGKNGVNTTTYNKAEDITGQFDFTVDYENGVLTFNNSQINKEIQVSYTNSIGRLSISADRIFTNIDNQGNIVKTLGTLLEEGRQTLSDLEVLGGATKVINELKAYIESIKELTGNNINVQIDDMNKWVERHGDIVNLNDRIDKRSMQLVENTITIDATGTNRVVVGQASANTISSIIGADGQELIIFFANESLTTIQDNANIKLQGGMSFTGKLNSILTLVNVNGTWYEKCRSINS